MREANLNDITKLVALFEEYYKESPMGLEYSKEKTINSFYNAIINRSCIISVLENGDDVVGMSIAQIEQPFYSCDSVLDVYAIYVHPKYRKGSAGVQLIKNLKKVAKENECSWIYLGVASGIQTERTKLLYKKLGYVEIGSDFRLEVK